MRALDPLQDALAQCYPIELSVLVEMFHSYTVQYGRHELHVVTGYGVLEMWLVTLGD